MVKKGNSLIKLLKHWPRRLGHQGGKFTTKIKKIINRGLFYLMMMMVLLGAAYLSYTIAYAKRSYPNLRLGTMNVSGKTVSEIEDMLKKPIAEVQKQDMVLVYETKQWKISAKALKASYDSSATAERVFSYGREKTFGKRLWGRIRALWHREQLEPVYSYNTKVVNDTIDKIAETVNKPEKDATGIIKDGQVSIMPEENGFQVKTEKLMKQIKADFTSFAINPIDVPVDVIIPKVTFSEAESAKTDAEALMKKQLIVTWEKGKWTVEPATMNTWVEFVAKPVQDIPGQDYILKAQINEARVKAYISGLAKQIDHQAKDARLKMKGSQVEVFQASQEGYKLNQEEAVKNITEALNDAGAPETTEVALNVVVTQPDVSLGNINNLGIKEIIGSATTLMSGSPQNRIHNIKNGVSFLNGALIKPGDTFSTLKTLGKIEASTGYLPELVIKENKTTPEFGGGLCQVSTTLFRAALNTGLKITERQNHAYRVIYYEKDGRGRFIGPGLDATIYIPRPDLKFVNDTGNYVLIEGHVSGVKITFNFWGTKDGRVAKIDGPYMSNVVPPPPNIYEETDTLPVGKEKQVEKAHPGATAVAYYTVTRGDQILFKQTFKSKYKPWPARILVGTKEKKADKATPTTPAPTTP